MLTDPPAAIIVGCLPSFAVFIRGRVEASRAPSGPYLAHSSSNGPAPLTQLRNSRAKSAARREGVLLDEMEPVGWEQGAGSRKSLVGDEIAVTQGWRRGSRRATAEDHEREGRLELGLGRRGGV